MNAENKSDLTHKITLELERAARTYVAMSAELAGGAIMVAAVREPEKFSDSGALMKAGCLVPQIVVQGRVLQIYLLDVETGAKSDTVFQYSAPVNK